VRPNDDARWRTELWDDDGYWQGPPDLGVFLRVNWAFAAMWAVVLIGIASAAIAAYTPMRGWFAPPFGIAAGGAAWLLFMLGFSHRLIAEGD